MQRTYWPLFAHLENKLNIIIDVTLLGRIMLSLYGKLCPFCRYSDFVVHEIGKDGSVVRLTDINPPTTTESQSDVTDEVTMTNRIYFCLLQFTS